MIKTTDKQLSKVVNGDFRKRLEANEKALLALQGRKRCTKCGDVKQVSEFHKDPRRNDGLMNQCRDCKCAAKNNYVATLLGRAKKAANRANTSASKYGINERITGDDVLDIKQAHPCCEYCGSESNLELEHIVPLSHGGRNHKDNLVVACRSCNARKNDTPLLVWFSRIIKSLGGVNLATGEKA